MLYILYTTQSRGKSGASVLICVLMCVLMCVLICVPSPEARAAMLDAMTPAEKARILKSPLYSGFAYETY